MPSPVDLPLPEGRPAGLAEVVSDLAGAAFHAGVLDAHLTGPAASAPGWLSADGTAAAEQVGRTATLTREICDALTSAWRRLDAHLQLLVTAVARIRGMRAAQADDFAHAYARISALEQENGPYGLPDPAVPILEELRAADHRRAREHALLLEQVAQDAADTARVLARSSAVVGGTGHPEDGGRVLTYLARQLPGWGEPELAELAARGSAVGAGLRDASPDTLVAVLQDHTEMLAAPAFAAAFVAALGPEALRRLVRWAGVAAHPESLPVMVGALMGAADSVSTADARLRRTLEAPLRGAIDASTAVGLGRISRAPGFTAAYRTQLVVRLAAEERAQPMLRRDELSTAPGEDPLTTAVSGLAAAGAPDEAAAVLADPDVWPGLLGRQWGDGGTALADLVRAATGGARGGDVAVTALDAIGAITDVLSGGPSVGAVVVARISPAVGNLVAAHLSEVTAPLIAAEGRPGVPREPLDDAMLRRLSGLGMVTRSLEARNTVLEALVDRMAQRLPDPAPGQPAPAAFAAGGVFGAMAFGERESIRQHLYSAAERAAADAAAWATITTLLGVIPVTRWGALRDALSSGLSLVGPGGVPIDAFFAQPETGPFQASFAAVAATVPGLVQAGALPDPRGALAHGLGSPEGLAYEASLTPTQRDLWDRLIGAAHEGFLAVGDGLGILPGSSTAG